MTKTRFKMARLSAADIPHGQIEIDGVRYWCPPIKEFRGSFTDDDMIVFEGSDIVNRCDSCGRGEIRPRTAPNFEYAIEKGWVTRVCDYEDASTPDDIATGLFVAAFECGLTMLIGNLEGLPREAVKDRHPWLPHECRLEQIPGDPSSVRTPKETTT